MSDTGPEDMELGWALTQECEVLERLEADPLPPSLSAEERNLADEVLLLQSLEKKTAPPLPDPAAFRVALAGLPATLDFQCWQHGPETGAPQT